MFMDFEEKEQQIAPVRPRLLTVLCYLTIFGSVYMMFSSLSGLLNPDSLTKSTTMAMENWEMTVDQLTNKDPNLKASLENVLSDVNAANSLSNMRDYSFFNLIYNLLTLFGARMMLKLRKNGFRLYFLGIMISFISPLLVFGADNLLGQAFALFFGITGGLFVILYALNIKYMD
jgi:hypothetical protein